jgi:hypothetical protein
MQPRPNIPYVKLLAKNPEDNSETELSFPAHLQFTDESKILFQRGREGKVSKENKIDQDAERGQGYIYFIDLENGNIHLLPAINLEREQVDDHRKPQATRDVLDQTIQTLTLKIDYYNDKDTALSTSEKSELSELLKQRASMQDQLKKIIQGDVAKTKLGIQPTVPLLLDNHGIPFKATELAISYTPLTSQTGGAGGGDLHLNGAHVLKQKHPALGEHYLAGGFWKGEENCFFDFRTRSTANMNLCIKNPLYTHYTSRCEQGRM